jgi:bacterioferritin (cytochrome b1)
MFSSVIVLVQTSKDTIVELLSQKEEHLSVQLVVSRDTIVELLSQKEEHVKTYFRNDMAS